ncbi:MAG: GNAT family N-acetyltransferase [Chitinophagaceae bacterium]|nr:GNAT family N-acetyltransferase [Chitinophagaceae bacterium]
MTKEDKKLDNPVWHSLNETHWDFGILYKNMKFYHPDYCPFGGFVNIDKTAISINKYSELSDNFYVVGNKPVFDNNLKLSKELVCNQMLVDKPIDIEMNETVVELQTNDNDDLFKLVNLVQPGYFKTKTSRLGHYYGIYKSGKLIAVTGERMKMNSYTEISAVVTHPDYTGKGFAKQLIAYAANKIFGENKTPYLHVADINSAAIRLYEKLNFKTRRKISFWNLIPMNN